MKKRYLTAISNIIADFPINRAEMIYKYLRRNIIRSFLIGLAIGITLTYFWK